MFKLMRFLRSLKCSKTFVELTSTTQKANACSLLVRWLFYFPLEIPFLGKSGPKTQNCQFKLNFVTYNNSSMQNSMMMFAFSIFNQKYLFVANMVQKIKIVSLNSNLGPKLIRICRIQ